MAHIRIYATSATQTASGGYTPNTLTANDELPSPTSISPTTEQIWSEDTGRSQDESANAVMIGKSVATKLTYAVKWDILATDNNGTATSKFNKIVNKLETGFFTFGVRMPNASIPEGKVFYRSEISYELCQEKDDVYYKGVSVSIIQR